MPYARNQKRVLGISDLIAYSMATGSDKEQSLGGNTIRLRVFKAVEGAYHPSHSRGAQYGTISTSDPTCNTSSQSKS